MKVLFLTIGDKTVASSRVRVFGYGPFLAKENIEYKIIPFTSPGKCKRILDMKKDSPYQYMRELMYKIKVIAKTLLLSKKYDVVVLQKVTLPKIVWSILMALNKRVVFDFDDAIYLEKDIKYVLKGARAVIVSNKTLETFVSGYSARIRRLVSPVQPEEGGKKEEDGIVTIGWVGSPEASKYLYSLLEVFEKLKAKFKNVRIKLLGSAKDERFKEALVETFNWSIEEEKKFLEKIDIGLMPLEDDEWSRAKAGYKILLYMSKGIPCAASPVGINSEIIKDGVNGYLARTSEEWLDKLSRLIEDKNLREEFGREGKKCARKLYSYEKCAPELVRILNGVYASLPK